MERPRDVVSEILKSVRFPRALYLASRLTAPFSLGSPQRFVPDASEAPRDVSQFHLVLAGKCMLETREGVQELARGDLVLLPYPERQTIRSGSCPTIPLSPAMLAAGPFEGIWTLSHGGGGAETRLVSGFIDPRELLGTPLFRSFPRLVLVHAADDPLCSILVAAVAEALLQVQSAAPGSHTMLDRLMESLFLHLVRQAKACIQGTQAGWQGAVSEPIVHRALQLIHGNIARRWTLSELARRCGTSRTVLCDRFNAVLGRPPMDYLLCWRMQLAAARLGSTRDPLGRIAEELGYASETAFSRAFRRVIGASPRAWRDKAVVRG